MINKQDFINKSTSLYDMDAVEGLNAPRPSTGINKTPADLVAEEEGMLPPKVQVAGLGNVVRRAVNKIAPKKFQADRSVQSIREDVLMPDTPLTDTDIQNVIAPEGPFTGTKQGDLSGMTPERNINLDNLQTGDDIKAVIDDMAQFQGGNVEARRGQISHAQTTMMANQSVDAIELITGWKPATTWNAEQITSARQLMVNVSQNIHVDAKRLMDADPASVSAADWANFAKKQRTFAAIQQTVAGATAEAGRTLSALKIPIKGDERLGAIMQQLDNAGGADLIKKQAELIASLDEMDPDMLASNINKALEAPNQGVLAEVWINGRLSSPVTHAVNIVSNSFVQAYESFMVKPTAATLGLIRKSAGGKDEAISYDEVGAETFGMLSSFGEAIELFGKRLGNKGDTDLFITPQKHELSQWNAFSSEKLLPATMQGSSFARVLDFVGDYYVRLPGKFLESEDLFFKTITYRKELNAQAVRIAKQEGLGGEAYNARVRELVNRPTQDMNAYATARSEYETFTNDPSQYDSLFGNMAKSFSYLTARHTTLKFIMPFIRTPANIVRYATENSVLAPVTKKWRADFEAGGVKRDMALARWSIGSMGIATIQQLYDTGALSGSGPSDPAARKAMQKMGWQQHSLRVGDKYYAFDKMDPMGYSMSIMASALDRIKYARSEEDATAMMLEATMSLGDSFMDKTFMTGFAELFQLMGHAGSGEAAKGATKFASNITASFVPAWLTVVAKAEDVDEEGRGITREPARFSKSYEGIWNNFRKSYESRTPWAKSDLPAQRNWKGDVVTSSGGGYSDELFFIKRSEAKNDPATRALLENWVAPRVPKQIQTIPIPEGLAEQYGVAEVEIDVLDLDANQGAVFEEFQAYVGRARNQLVTEFTKSKAYRDIPKEQRGNKSFASSVLESLLESGYQAGKMQFFSDYNTLAKERGWAEFTDDKVIQLIERKLSERGKEFAAPAGPSAPPEF